MVEAVKSCKELSRRGFRIMLSSFLVDVRVDKGVRRQEVWNVEIKAAGGRMTRPGAMLQVTSYISHAIWRCRDRILFRDTRRLPQRSRS